MFFGFSKNNERVFKIISTIIEAFMIIPLISWSIIISVGFPIIILLAVHVFSLITARKSDGKILGNILGIFAAFLSIVPFVGWLLHVITLIVLIIDIRQSSKSSSNETSLEY